MNFYEAVVEFKQLKTKEKNDSRALFAPEGDQHEDNFIKSAFEEINRNLGVKCDDNEAFSIFFWSAGKGKANLIFSVDMEKANVEDAIIYIKSYMEENYDVKDVLISGIKEITTERFHQLGEKGDNNGIIRRFRSDEDYMGIDFRNNCQYQIHEDIIDETEMSLDEAIEKSRMFMADDSLVKELERIYSDENEKKYYGNPVHYKMRVSDIDAAIEMTELLAKALKVNNRLEGSRINRIYEIKESCYNEADFVNMFEKAKGNIVLFDLSGNDENHRNYASAYEDVVDFICELIRKYHIKTLCVFAENTKYPGFADKLLARAVEEIDIIELKEGCGNREATIEYICNIARRKKYELSGEEIEEIIPDKQIFKVGEAYEIYNKWFKNGLKDKIYKAYKYCSCMEVINESKVSDPYIELQKMVGLKEIKQIVDEIIDSARVQNLRSKMGMDTYRTSLHMVFTGNPGSAKTSVARLIAQIFTKEGVLSTGKYVECGRADLVGKYVGWTDKTVRRKFREARGGVLFIDEAYSLVDDSNSFGDEAINTIVQEMENNRNDVIVIFAGYPDKMEKFLAKNEGLRSRIAFHLNFPDYNADELVDILKLMADMKGYKLNDEIKLKCHDIFEIAVSQKEFGNGRFARNLLEQAMMAQSRRIIKEYKGKKVTRKALATLKAEDFDVNIMRQYEKNVQSKIGFAV